MIYGMATRVRSALYARRWLKQERLQGIVISIGNITVGGTGKTPMVIWLGQRLLAKGKRVAILSRGYHGSGGTSDEVELMKNRLEDRAVFGVGKDRFTEGRRIEMHEPVDVFLLDDGFQHLQLARDLDIVMVDGSKKLTDEWLLPAGILREPVSALRRADLVVMTRKTEDQGIQDLTHAKHPIASAETNLLGFRLLNNGSAPQRLGELPSGSVFAFCGIGNPRAFLDDLERWNISVVGSKFFGDHHHYSVRDVLAIEAAAAEVGARALVTTEKDANNLRGLEFCSGSAVYAAVIDLAFTDENLVLQAIDRLLPRSDPSVAQ
jgi:tetraacyldisaccharide 4'-kinase